MRLLVTSRPQNAPFRRMRFSSPAQTPTRLTQKRTLTLASHAKAHSDPGTLRKDPRVRLSVRTSYRMRFSVQHGLQNALFRRVRFSSPAQTPTHLTQKRTLSPAPHAKAHSACVPSPKDALCIPATATKNRCNPSSPQRDPSAVRPGEARRATILLRWGDGLPPPPPTSTPSVPLPVPRKHQVLRLGLGCIKRTFRFGKWRVAFTPISLPCPTQQRGKTGNGSVEPRRKVKERRS